MITNLSLSSGKLAFSNQKTLAQRIDDIVNAHPSDVAILTVDMPDFAARVRHTRNYYTHYDPDLLRKKKIAQGPELIYMTNVLEGLLKICLLNDLGITGRPIVKVLECYCCVESLRHPA